jgi:hypothetical protein
MFSKSLVHDIFRAALIITFFDVSGCANVLDFAVVRFELVVVACFDLVDDFTFVFI